MIIKLVIAIIILLVILVISLIYPPDVWWQYVIYTLGLLLFVLTALSATFFSGSALFKAIV